MPLLKLSLYLYQLELRHFGSLLMKSLLPPPLVFLEISLVSLLVSWFQLISLLDPLWNQTKLTISIQVNSLSWYVVGKGSWKKREVGNFSFGKFEMKLERMKLEIFLITWILHWKFSNFARYFPTKWKLSNFGLSEF